MASSKQRGSLYDPIRKMWVAATAEEYVRQRLLDALVHQLGFPQSLIVVEKQLSELPHLLEKQGLPLRRTDILCYVKLNGELNPLLLIECKEMDPGKEAKEQVLGYNYYVEASCVAIAGPKRVELIYPHVLSYLPSFLDLQKVQCR